VSIIKNSFEPSRKQITCFLTSTKKSNCIQNKTSNGVAKILILL